MFYEAREIKPYAEHVNADRLEEGAVYFSCMFLDDGETGSPVLEPLVFIGRNLLPEDVHGSRPLYISRRALVSAGSPPRLFSSGSSYATDRRCIGGDATWFFEYERALDS